MPIPETPDVTDIAAVVHACVEHARVETAEMSRELNARDERNARQIRCVTCGEPVDAKTFRVSICSNSIHPRLPAPSGMAESAVDILADLVSQERESAMDAIEGMPTPDRPPATSTSAGPVTQCRGLGCPYYPCQCSGASAPSEPATAPCEVCGRPTGGCCTVVKQHDAGCPIRQTGAGRCACEPARALLMCESCGSLAAHVANLEARLAAAEKTRDEAIAQRESWARTNEDNVREAVAAERARTIKDIQEVLIRKLSVT